MPSLAARFVGDDLADTGGLLPSNDASSDGGSDDAAASPRLTKPVAPASTYGDHPAYGGASLFLPGTGSDTGCILFPGRFGLAVQGALGAFCFCTLIVKWLREKPRRPLQVFSRDSSKQVIGGLVIHILNLLVSMLLSIGRVGDECDWYFTNIVTDCTLGVVITWRLLRWSEARFGYKSGEYDRSMVETDRGPVSNAGYRRQIVIWVGIVTCMKLVITLMLVLCGPMLEKVSQFLLWVFDDSYKTKLIVVMIVTPTVMNTLQFWLLDTALKAQEHKRAVGREENDDADIGSNADRAPAGTDVVKPARPSSKGSRKHGGGAKQVGRGQNDLSSGGENAEEAARILTNETPGLSPHNATLSMDTDTSSLRHGQHSGDGSMKSKGSKKKRKSRRSSERSDISSSSPQTNASSGTGGVSSRSPGGSSAVPGAAVGNATLAHVRDGGDNTEHHGKRTSSSGTGASRRSRASGSPFVSNAQPHFTAVSTHEPSAQ